MLSDERIEWQQDEDELAFEFFDRMLGGNESDYGTQGYVEGYVSAGAIPLFYRVLKYGIFTLYLILFVEFVRHTIDSAARGRPFFTAVLRMVYSELATLGIVEFGVFLWGKYWTINKDVKTKFADVHFALFLTAILNALQYSLACIISTRLSNSKWVKTEQLELDHYVEIREEYDRVQEIIDLQYTGCGKWVRNCILFVCRPGLKKRHDSLRVQVRFHELRLHFLESNNLPSGLKVSDYLKRSELDMLIGLVHVSVGTWVLLIGILNVGYFVFGIIGYSLSNPGYIARLFAALFFVVVISFILLSWALRWKMRKIFQTVMKTKVLDTTDREEGIRNQNQLFWFGSPRLVISMIQLMNFGYAISISIIFIYWDYLNENPGLSVEIYLVLSLGCYGVFLYNLATLLPEYTLCTSLGYLTNPKELAETVAMHRLEEAERQRRKKIIENATKRDSTILQAYPVAKSSTVAENTDARTVLPLLNNSPGGALPDDKDTKASLLVSDLVKINTTDLRRNLPEESREILKNREERIRHRRANRKKSVSDGVAAMRAWNQASANSVSQETREDSKRNTSRPRSRIRKTISQPGVIQAWQNITASEEPRNRRHSVGVGRTKNRRKSSSDPRIIQGWQETLLEEEGMAKSAGAISSEEKVSISRITITENNKETNDDREKARLQGRAARKRARRKTQSASAIIQSWQNYSVQESVTETNETLSDKNYKSNGQGALSSDENYNSSDLRGLSSDDGSDDNIQSSKSKSSHFYGARKNYTEPLAKRQPDIHTLREIEDHMQVSTEGGTGATSDRKLVIDLSNTGIIHEGKEFVDDDQKSIDTEKSVGNLSDIDVIQAEKVGSVSDSKTISRTVEIDLSWHTVLTRKTRKYFASTEYRNVSHVVGTSTVFCLIGYRVEVMLKISNEEETPLTRSWTLWGEIILLSCFVIADFAILVLFPICKFSTEVDRRLCVATIIDILIIGSVLSLLLLAEANRCCVEQSLSDGYSERNDDNLFYSGCTCPIWGTRTYGGLGMFEPFTSLIFLRLFRFQFANYLISLFSCKRDLGVTINDSKSNPDSQNETKRSDHHGQISHGHDGGSENKCGSALELWERAIREFPDIVQKHGEFSGELLQAMLGLDIMIEVPFVPTAEDSETPATKKNVKLDLNKGESMDSHIKLAQSRYAKLPPRAQGIVIAGSLRKPVKPMYLEGGLEPPSASLPGTGLVDFEIDNERMASEQNTSYSFVAPFAKLVRSMRRCDRRHLPLLKGWISVDVVMTQFEIVYFEAIDSYYSNLDEKTRNHCEACRLALKATKGGKSLRLCDVALGRKVVGHLDLADVTEVHVAKDDVPISDMALVERAAFMFNKEHDLEVEHWCNPYHDTEAKKKYARIIRWTLIQEERLKISTNSGCTLYFRFYSDLAHFEAENSGETLYKSQTITRDIAFQWAETITRICGRSQLQQYLPHFGEENEAELRDYLEVVHFHEKEAENERKNNTRGVEKFGHVERLFVDTEERTPAKKKTMHKRFKSMMDLSSVDLHASVKSESLQEGDVSSSKPQGRSVKLSAEFKNMPQPLQKGLKRSHSVGNQLDRADNLV